MGKPISSITIHGKTHAVLLDTGAAVTIIGTAYAKSFGLTCPRGAKTEDIPIGGIVTPTCQMRLRLAIPDTDCSVEMPVQVATDSKRDGVTGMVVGADFMERTGMMLDLRKGNHRVGCHRAGRNPKPPDIEDMEPFKMTKKKRRG